MVERLHYNFFLRIFFWEEKMKRREDERMVKLDYDYFIKPANYGHI